MTSSKPDILRLILGDQLNISHSWFRKSEKHVHYVMMETHSETDYVRHHIQKVTGFFKAMRAFSEELRSRGHSIIYLTLDDSGNKQSISGNLQYLVNSGEYSRLEYQEPDEFRLDQELRELQDVLDIPVKMTGTEHFFTTRPELASFFRGRKTYVMESFYRHLRRKHDILMEGDEPVGGTWNYDKSNRKSLPAGKEIPDPLLFNHDVRDILNLLKKQDVQTIGRMDPGRFIWPVNRDESLRLLDYFLDHLLQDFGTYQDAMTAEHIQLFHSRLSFSMNTKMVSPGEVISRTLEHWEKHGDTITIAQVEGFIRQILGWREYLRGIYWTGMPEFAGMNYFSHSRPLPSWYWDGNTRMRCLACAVSQSLDHAYAHHIQRLMITGNFALLSGVHPDEVDAWYLGVYMDAVEWVEITNTRGMSQFADGGLVGTKPYVSSANYISRMSNYCDSCYYDNNSRTGENACPFNSLYWNFFMEHESLLSKNPRIGMVYRNLDRMKARDKRELSERARYCLDHIGEL